MAFLIDGYNLLHASGVFPSSSGPPTLERSRLALLDFLVERIHPKLLARTRVVFDAVHAPPGLEREMTHRGLAVMFAHRGGSADELLEQLIAAEPDPRNLLVVSSDHRVQRAARQRGAQYIDSEAWVAVLPRSSTSDDPGSEKNVVAADNPFPPGYVDDILGDGELE